ncbi:MAG: DJ-1/PfpI family protein [Cytophagaceae bacterium]|nr:DJ-1/PfpI family protein [Cytophagaceae bacterium]
MKRVGIVVSTVGFHWEELFDAYKEFKEAGWEIKLFTINGEPAVADPKSLERKPLLSLIGLGLSKSYSPQTDLGKEISGKVKTEVRPVSELQTDTFDALYIPGGHGCLFDVNMNEELHGKILEIYDHGKILAAVCHGSSVFAFVKERGIPIIYDRYITGFPDFMDKLLLKAKWIFKKFLPLPFWNEETIKKAGAKFNRALSILNPLYKVVDYPFITGVGPKAAKGVAKEVIIWA